MRVRRALAQAPTLLYRARLGRFLGHRFVMVTHVGRTTGRLRHTVLEVVELDRADRAVTVVSARGDRADWFRNAVAAGDVVLDLAGRRGHAAVQVLDVAARTHVLERYERRHPVAARALRRVVLGSTSPPGPAGARVVAEQMSALRLTPVPRAPTSPTRP